MSGRLQTAPPQGRLQLAAAYKPLGLARLQSARDRSAIDQPLGCAIWRAKLIALLDAAEACVSSSGQ